MIFDRSILYIVNKLYIISRNYSRQSRITKYLDEKRKIYFKNFNLTHLSNLNKLKERIKTIYDKYKRYDQYLLLEDKNKIKKINKKLEELFNYKKIKLLKKYDLNKEDPYNLLFKTANEIKGYIQFFEGYNTKYKELEIKKHRDIFNSDEVSLTDEQCKAVIVDDKYNQIIAGAGTGKTFALIKKIKYLIEKGVPENRILAITYTNEASDEMFRRLSNKNNKTNVNIRTIHSFGYNVINNIAKEKMNFFSEKKAKILIRNIIIKLILDPPDDSNFRFNFLNYYDIFSGNDIFKSVYEKMTAYKKNYPTKDDVKVRSQGEREIANFFIDNRIEYEYEKSAEWSDWNKYEPDFYLKNYDLYLEHWGVNRKGEVPKYWKISSSQYNQQIKDKRRQFKKHNKILLETWYYWFKEGKLIDKLTELMNQYYVTLKPIPGEEYKKELLRNSDDLNRVIDRYYEFINLFKKHDYESIDDILSKIPNKISLDWNNKNSNNISVFDRAKYEFFYKSAYKLFKEYQNYLNENNLIDYVDMIKIATEEIKQKDNFKNIFDYILVDEFQDVEKTTVEFIKSILEVNEQAKLFVVGDDWQSIYGFNGSSPKYFIDFDDYFNDQRKIYLTNNFRSPKQVISIGNNLIKNNKKQISKKVKSVSNINKKPVIYFLNNDYYLFNQAENIVSLIDDLNKKGVNEEDILIITRNLRSGNGYRKGVEILLNKLQEHNIKYNTKHDNKTTGVRIFSVHATKGLESEHVIIMDVNENYDGDGYDSLANLPSIISFQDELTPLRSEYNIFEEERRLLYVAITRTKKGLYIFTNKKYSSKFIREIKNKRYVKTKGEFKDNYHNI